MDTTQLIRDFWDHAPGALGIYELTDSGLTLLALNDNYYRMIGADRTERTQYSAAVTSAIPPEDRAAMFGEIRAAIAEGRDADCRIRILRGDGEYGWFAAAVHPVKTAENTYRLYAVFADMTAMKKREDRRAGEAKRLEHIHEAFVEGLNRIHDAEYMLDLEEETYYAYGRSETFTPVSAQGTYADLYRVFVGSFPEGSLPREEFEHSLTKDEIRARLNDGSLYEYTYSRDMKDGTRKWYTLHMTAVRREAGDAPVRYIVICTTDVTDSIAAQQELQSRLEKDAAIIRKSSMDAYDFIAVIDCATQTIELRGGSWFNDHVPTPDNMRVLPYTALLDYIGKNYTQNPEAGKQFYEKFAISSIEKELETAPQAFFPFNFMDADKKERVKYKQFRFSWLDESHTRLLATRADVTSVMEKEQEANARLKDALTAAEAANRAKSDFLSRMSHDIRTPMNAIIGFSTLLLRNASDPEKVTDQSRKILSSSNHLLGLINDVLDMSKIETGEFQMTIHEFRLADTLSMIDDIIRPQMEKRQQTFDLYVSGIRHDAFLGDDQRLQQVLINILSNATKYTPAGGHIVLRVRSLPETSGQIETVSFAVSDTGRGMTKEYQQQIFEPFSREQLSGQESAQGTGLGMAITKNLVNMMGGTITLESELGVGSTFTVVLPLQLPDREKDYAFWTTHSLTHMLVVDDEEEVCRNVCETMEGTGVRMEYALSGEMSIHMLTNAAAEEDDFDVVLLDWKMPGMDGVETARAIRRVLPPEVLIIILTAYDYSAIEEEARAAGVDGFMSKPFFIQSFEKAIQDTGRIGEETEEASEEHEEREAASADIAGLNILAAEDNELNAEILVEVMRLNGAEVTVEPNGEEVVKRFAHAAAGEFDLILMDVQMPVMNGYEATRAIRAIAGDTEFAEDKRREAAAIPIIAMTANAFSDDVQQALLSGMNAHVAKPLDVASLRKTIAGLRAER